MIHPIYEPRLVVTIHGIRTRGEWQKRITPYLAKYGLVPYHIDYGFFGLVAFLVPWTREARFKRIRDELRILAERSGAKRMSVIAHSFGTWVAMETLVREEGTVHFDRVVLTGSIVHPDFDWERVMTRKHWVNVVRNERTSSDWAVSLCDFYSSFLGRFSGFRAGKSGVAGFTRQPRGLLDYETGGGHSEVHHGLKFEQWARFIAYPFLGHEMADSIRRRLSSLRLTLAQMLDENASHIRINLFAPVGNVLRIIPGAMENMNYAPELSLVIEPGMGATGHAFISGEPVIVFKDNRGWSGSSLPIEELQKINPDLKWVISTPLFSKVSKMVIGVMNVDGVADAPEVLRREPKAVLWNISAFSQQVLLPRMNAAYRGDDYEN